jgi:hypothetical protein
MLRSPHRLDAFWSPGDAGVDVLACEPPHRFLPALIAAAGAFSPGSAGYPRLVDPVERGLNGL